MCNRLVKFTIFVDLSTAQKGLDRGILRSMLMNSSIADLMPREEMWSLEAFSNDFSESREMSLTERASVMSVISANSHILPSSFVELAPLVIAAIVGGVALAAVAAAAVAFLGAAGLTVGLLWAFGVFNSHKDRRRKDDTVGACESTNPLDTNDPDCFALRFNNIASYYPYHANLKKMEKAVVRGQEEITSLWDKAYYQSQRLEDQIFGPGGTAKRPNSAYGLHHDVNLLTTASQQLQGVSVASIDGSINALERMNNNANNDVGTLKQNLAYGLGNLTEAANAAMGLQAKSTEMNTMVMTGMASKVLSDALDVVLGSQSAAKDDLVSTYKEEKNAISEVQFNKKILRGVLSDSEETVKKLEKTIDSRFQRVSSQIESETGTSLKALSSKSQETQTHARLSLDGLAQEFSSSTIGQVRTSRADWSTTSSSVLSKSKALADALDDEVLVPFVGNQTVIIGSGAKNIGSSIDSLQLGIEQRQVDGKNTAKQLSKGTASLGSDTSNATANIQSDSAELVNYIETNMAGIRGKILAHLMASGGGNIGNSEIFGAVQGAQTDSRKSLIEGENGYVSDITGALKSLGNSGSLTGQSLESLIGLIGSGKAKSSADVERQIQSMMAGTRLQGSQLLNSIDLTGNKVKISGNAFNSIVQGLSESVEGDMRSGKSVVVSGLLSLSGLSSSSSIIDDIHTSSQSNAGKIGSSQSIAVRILNAVQGLDKRNGNLNSFSSESLSGQSDAIAGLLSLLGHKDDSIANAISAEMKKAQLTVSGVQSGLDQSRLGQIVRATMRAISGTKGNGHLILDEKSMLGKTQALSQFAQSLWTEATGSVDKTNNRLDRISKTGSAKFLDLNQSMINSLVSLSTLGGVGLNTSLSETILPYLGKILENAKSGLATNNDNYRSVQDQTSALSVSLSVNDKSYNNLVTNGHSASENVASLINNILKSLTASKTADSKSLAGISDKLELMKTTMAEGLKNISKSVRSEVLRVPLMVREGTSELERDMATVSENLVERIQRAKKGIASAKTDQEKQSAEHGLLVLEKLQAVQQGVYEADRRLRTQIGREKFSSSETDMGISRSLETLLKALSGIGSLSDKDIGILDNHWNVLSGNSESLFHGIETLVNSSSSELLANGAQSVLKEALWLAQQRERLNGSEKLLAGNTDWSLNRTDKYWSSNMDHVGTISSNIGGTKRVVVNVSKSLSETIDRVISDVDQSHSMIMKNLTSIDDDILTKIALVRMAVASLLSLWNEFVSNADQRHYEMTISDRELIASIETNVRRILIESESFVNTTSRESLGGLRAIVKNVEQSQSDFENSFSHDIKRTVKQLGEVNTRRNQDTLKAHVLIDQVVNLGNENVETSLDAISSILDSIYVNGE